MASATATPLMGTGDKRKRIREILLSVLKRSNRKNARQIDGFPKCDTKPGLVGNEAQPEGKAGQEVTGDADASDVVLEENARQYFRILDLPLDVFRYIVGFLEPEDTACFLLCSHGILRILGRGAWDFLQIGKGSDDHREKFLLCYARNYADSYFCPECLRLHVSNRVAPLAHIRYQEPYSLRCPLQIKDSRKTDPAYISGYHNMFDVHQELAVPYIYELKFVHAYLAMAGHTKGMSYGIPLDTLSLIDVREHWKGKLRSVVTLLSVEPNIIAEQLHLRVQNWILVPNSYVDKLPELRFMDICIHIRKQDNDLASLIRCKIEHADSRPFCPTCRPFLQCKHCGVVFQIVLHQVDQSHKALVVTKMLNLGHGDDDEADEWERHGKQPFSSNCGSPFSIMRSDHDPTTWSAAAVEDLTRKNANILETQLYREEFVRLPRDRWQKDSRPGFQNVWLHQPNCKIDELWVAGRSNRK